MNDDYDYRATFDFSQADLKAIERALTILEEKFAILGDYDENSLSDGLQYCPRDEVFIRKATDVLKREWDVFVDDDDVDVDEIRGHMLSVEQLRPTVRRLRDLLERGESNLRDLLGAAHDACMIGILTLDRVRPNLTELPVLREAMFLQGPNVMALLPKEGDVSLLDADEIDGNGAEPA